MKVIVAPDSYKNCLSAMQVAQAISDGVSRAYPDAECCLLPASDGGEGFLPALADSLDCQYIDVPIHNALMQPITVQIGIVGNMAIIESAQAVGFSAIQDEYSDIMQRTSYGVGEMIAAALNHKCSTIIIGLGGSTTNDGGMGMMQALGVKFFNHAGLVLPHSANLLNEVADCNYSELHKGLSDCNIIIAGDVNNPLCGDRGATAIFSKQKGATTEQQDILEAAVVSYAHVVSKATLTDYMSFQGAGAAGGIAFALLSFCRARYVSGGELWLNIIDFAANVADADIVITGEGKSDSQTIMGKLPYLVLRECKKHGKPCVLLSGQITASETFKAIGFDIVKAATPQSMPLSKALMPDIAYSNIAYCASQLSLE